MYNRQYETPNTNNPSKQFQHLVETTTDFDTRFMKHLDISGKQANDLPSKFQAEEVYVGDQQPPNSKPKKKSKTLDSDGEFYRARLLGNIVDKIKQAKDVTNLTKYSEHDALLDRFDKLENVIQDAVYQSSIGKPMKKTSSQDATVKQIIKQLSSIRREGSCHSSQNNNELNQPRPIYEDKNRDFQHQQFLQNMDDHKKEYAGQMHQNVFHLRKKSIERVERPRSYSKITFTYTSPTPNNYKLHSPNKVIVQGINKIPKPIKQEKQKQQEHEQKVERCRKCGRDCPCSTKIKACMKCGRRCNCSRRRKQE